MVVVGVRDRSRRCDGNRACHATHHPSYTTLDSEDIERGERTDRTRTRTRTYLYSAATSLNLHRSLRYRCKSSSVQHLQQEYCVIMKKEGMFSMFFHFVQVS